MFSFLVFLFCIRVSITHAAVPVQFSDISLQLSPATTQTCSVQNGILYVHTDWQPRFDTVSVCVSKNEIEYELVPTSQPGEYKSTVAAFGSDVQNLQWRLTSENENARESITMDSSGNLLLTEIREGSVSFRHNLKRAYYTYTLLDPVSEITTLPVYMVKYDQTGNVLSYQRRSGENMEISYGADDTVIRVDALIACADGTGDTFRITWDFENQCWYDSITSETVDYPPYVPEEETSSPTDPELPPGNGEDPANGDTGNLPSDDKDPVPNASAPYHVSAPALKVDQLNVHCNPAALYHLPLGSLQNVNGFLVLSDQGYESVTILCDHPVPMENTNGQWTCLYPDSPFTVVLNGPNGLSSWYDSDRKPVSVMNTDTSLRLQSDGTYLYDGTGRENVVASYSAQGDLLSYSYHNEDNSKKVAYDPYGELLFYTASSSDGYVYRYSNHEWQRKESDGQWKNCAKPSDVNPSDLPPLLLLQREQQRPVGTWYPKNTAGIIGVSLRDRFPDLTRKWYHVLPVDLTIQGTQVFKMVASNLFYIGYVFVTVQGDSVCVEYRYSDGLVFPKEEMFRWFTSIHEITHDFLEHPDQSLQYGQFYSIPDTLGGAETALLFVCNKVTYRQPIWNDGTMLVRYWPNIESVKAHRFKAEQMLDQMMTSE